MELVFRFAFLVILTSALLISGTFRRRARQSGEVIMRRDEGLLVLFMRLALALPLLIALLLYIIYPVALTWARIELPVWLRGFAMITGLLVPVFLIWVFRSIGRNISETVLTKSDQELVTSGPYQWIRHPLYAGSLLLLFSLGVIASNWLFLLYAAMGVLVFRVLVIPREEQNLLEQFGDSYDEYRRGTGALFPKLF